MLQAKVPQLTAEGLADGGLQQAGLDIIMNRILMRRYVRFEDTI